MKRARHDTMISPLNLLSPTEKLSISTPTSTSTITTTPISTITTSPTTTENDIKYDTTGRILPPTSYLHVHVNRPSMEIENTQKQIQQRMIVRDTHMRKLSLLRYQFGFFIMSTACLCRFAHSSMMGMRVMSTIYVSELMMDVVRTVFVIYICLCIYT